MEAKESRTASGVIVAFGLACLIGIIVAMTATPAIASPANDVGSGVHISIVR